MADRLVNELTRTVQAGTRVILLQSSEEDRVQETLDELARRLDWPLKAWSEAAGGDLSTWLDGVENAGEGGLFVAFDPCPQGAPSKTVRRLRELAQRGNGAALVLVATKFNELLEIPEAVLVRLSLPDRPRLRERIIEIGEVLQRSGYADASACFDAHASEFADAGIGLRLREMERLLAEGVLEHGTQADQLLAYLRHHKAQALDRRGLLEAVDTRSGEELGGLHHFKAWLAQRALALHPDAAQAAIPPPRGVFLVGVQGCGKSLAARICAHELGLPLFRLDPGRVFQSSVGGSEARMRELIETVDRMAPVVLWVDEIDKGLAGFQGSRSDAGTASRVIGSFLTWLQDRRRPVFVVATANRVDGLPPELWRRGRLDELFFVDLPGAEAREEILRIHLELAPKRTHGHVPPTADEWPAFARLAHDAEGFSGAEIEAALIEARLTAFADRRPVAAADLASALAATVPLSRSHAEAIADLRNWAKDRARSA